MGRRRLLDRDRVVAAAVRVADRDGLGGVSMRTVGRELGVEAMSLYHHVAGKEALLDALADHVFGLIEPPVPGSPWRSAMAARARSARAALRAHPWALGLLESRRSPGPVLLAHHEAVLACLRTNGLTVQQAAHAFSVLDAYVYGFVLTEVNLPFAADGDVEGFLADNADVLAPGRHPHLAEMVEHLVAGGDYDYGDEFEVGLELVLDGVERLVQTSGQG